MKTDFMMPGFCSLVEFKHCPKCDQFKPAKDFALTRGFLFCWCRTCKNQEATNWRNANPEKIRQTNHSQYAKDKKARITYNREYEKRKREEDPSFVLPRRLRKRTRDALRGGPKAGSTMTLCGCSRIELRHWLEGWFEPGMSWENYGSIWHIDHNMPCASFDLTDVVQQKKCFHYLNLRPLFKEDNLRKGKRVPS